MTKLISRPARILRKIALFFRVIKYKFKVKTGLLGRPVIQPYYGYGNKKEIVVQGRVVENNVLSKPLSKYRKWDNLVAMYKRYLSDSIPNARVGVAFDGQWKKVEADKMGYFDLSFKLSKPVEADVDWLNVELELLDKIVRKQKEVREMDRKIPPRCLHLRHEVGRIHINLKNYLISFYQGLVQCIRKYIIFFTHHMHSSVDIRRFFKAVATYFPKQCILYCLPVSISPGENHDH